MALLSYLRKLFCSRTLPRSIDVLFFGLGNPGERYSATRHNIGFRVAQALSERIADIKSGSFGNADFSSGRLFSTKIVLVARPRTFMNRSGDAVAAYVDRWQFPVSQALVIVDDYHLPLGKLRGRRGGSDGGHNGLKSIAGRMGENFPRLRVGIGPLPEGISAIDFVLGPFTDAQEELLKTAVPRAADACMAFAQGGIETVMNAYNNS